MLLRSRLLLLRRSALLVQVGRLQAIAFQSVRLDDSAGGGFAHRNVAMTVTAARSPKGAAPAMESVLSVQRTLVSEESAVHQVRFQGIRGKMSQQALLQQTC